MQGLPAHSIVKPPADFEPLPPDALDSSLVTLIERTVARYPERIAIRDQGREISYAELNAAANALAYAILDRCGRGNEPIVFVLGHEAKALVALLSILKSGRPYLPLSPDYPPDRLRFIVSESDSPLILTDSKRISLVDQIRHGFSMGVLNVDEVALTTNRGNPGIIVDAGEPAGILYTSGSTGEPKGVVMSHRFVAFQALGDFDSIYCSGSDRHALLNALSFTAARPPVYDSWFTGATICMYDVRSRGVTGVSEWLASEKITVLFSLTPVFRAIFSSLPDETTFPSLRLVWVSGDMTYTSDVNLARKHTLPACVFRNSLGSSEAGLVAMNLLDHSSPLQGDVVPIGYPIPGKEVRLLNESGQPVAPGEVGEIVIRSRFLASGYWKSPELTVSKFQTDPHDLSMHVFQTGDLGRWNREGKLEHLGRIDNQVKIRGYRVDIAEIEGALRQHPDIKNLVVVTHQAKDQSTEKQLVAYVVPQPGAVISPVDLQNHLATKLPGYMIPSFFVFLADLPLNENGKVNRSALPEPHAQKELQITDLPSDQTEAQLLEIWKKTIGRENIGIHDDFFQIGGSSLQAASMFALIEHAFGKRYPPNLLLTHGSIHALAGLLLSGVPGRSGRLIPLRASGTRPVLFIIPGGGSDVITLMELTEALGEDQPVFGFQDFDVEAQVSLYEQGMEAAAAEFIRAMKSIQPQGPYHLAGHSFGGVVAFEMACQLRAGGDAVGLLGLLDSFPPLRFRRKGTWRNRLRSHLANMRPLDFAGKAAYVSSRFKRTIFRMAAREPLQKILPSGLIQTVLGEDAIRFVRIALERYHPEQYEGHAVVYRAMHRPQAVTWDVTAPWSELILGGVEFRDVPGQHRSIIKQPNVGALASWLKQDLTGEVARR